LHTLSSELFEHDANEDNYIWDPFTIGSMQAGRFRMESAPYGHRMCRDGSGKRYGDVVGLHGADAARRVHGRL